MRYADGGFPIWKSSGMNCEGWGGEAEGLKVSLAAANAKLAQLDNLIARRTAAVDLGMPTFADIAVRTTSTDPP